MNIDKSIIKVGHDICTGCAACANICPTQAIKMDYDGEGFIYPYVTETKCINCGKCYSVCPAIKFEFKNTPDPECYAAWASDDLRKVSSSGGIFSVLALYVLNMQGIIYGARFTNDYLNVEHIYAENKEQLKELRQSKYIQSKISENLFKEIKKQLNLGRYVLFCGCPCQVAGLINYLSRQYKNLITCDLVCHGANSLKAYHAFLKDKSNNRKILSVNFRDKSVYPWSTITDIRFSDGTQYLQTGDTCTWYKGFLNGITVRDICLKCPYAKTPRVGDFTLGDWWHVQKIDPSLNDRKGTTQLLTNTDKSKHILGEIKKNLKLLKPTSLDYAKIANPSLKEPMKTRGYRELFFENLDKTGYDIAVNRALNKHFDIGVIGWWYNDNYGGVLTCYSLYSVLKKLGYTVLMIDIPTIVVDRKQEQLNTMSRKFGRKHYLPLTEVSSMEELNKYCDTFLSGTDQMWNYNQRQRSSKRFDYHLAFADENRNTLTYATSYGDTLSTPDKDYSDKAKAYANKIKNISVREDYAVAGLKQLYGVDSTQVLDPIFLSDINTYDNIAKESKYNDTKYEYVLSFILNPNKEKIEASRYIANKLNKRLVIVSDPEPLNKNKITEILHDCPEWISYVELEDFVALMINAAFIFTDSYHGTCFSMLLRKNFISYANKERGTARFTSLYRTFNIKNSLINSVNEIYQNESLFNAKDYKTFDSVLYNKKSRSLTWLINALDNKSDKQLTKNKILQAVSELNEVLKNII